MGQRSQGRRPCGGGKIAMRINFVRHATFVFESGGRRGMVDPMLAAAGAAVPVPDTPNQRRNPLVDLPFGDEGTLALLEETDLVLVTHLHNDHWDERSAAGFRRAKPVEDALQWNGLGLARTGGRHGTGEIGDLMGPVSGFVVRAEDSPTLYVAGDTIFCSELEEALDTHEPDVVVVNAGA